ncbi:EAL domain-containing protein [Kineococcus sp. TBRC 1896]|uniref:EAL domain-containing protein n=1 Tax=Kineococcus mangrovi TaxID=1660183 RepID=A0ABV4I591_9ACTN
MPDLTPPAAVPDEWWQASPCAHLVLDGDAGLVLDANGTFAVWTGLSRDQVVGTPFARLLPVGDRIVWTTHGLPKLATSGAVQEVSVEVLGAGGTRHAAFLSAVTLPDPTGGDGGGGSGDRVLVALYGARERRRYEQELLASTRAAEASEARRARAEAHLQHLAHHDPVTGALNRAGLHAALTGALSTAPAEGVGLAVFFLDLDGFKAVNDSVGHAGGDELLRILAGRLRAALRPEAVLARFAGDEFVVLEFLAGEAEAVALCRRLLAALAVPVVVSGIEVVPSASAGIALAQGLEDLTAPCRVDEAVDEAVDAAAVGGARACGEAADALLRRADTAMYQVKSSGRGGLAVHDLRGADGAADRLRLLQELRTALAEDQFRLHFQPRVRLSDGSTTGVEALVRWQHPERGLLRPEAFIEVAEASGLIREIGAWVLDGAVAQAAVWNAAGAGAQVSVNISTRQLNDPDLVLLVTSALARHGVPAAQVVLEITETALMVDPDAALVTLRALAELGMQVAVDDFGTGYASLTYLQRFPVHELKIDRSFVARVVDSASDRAIVGACVHLARSLGLVSVAEGVETREQRDALVSLGCDLAQGYLFSPPRPPGPHP